MSKSNRRPSCTVSETATTSPSEPKTNAPLLRCRESPMMMSAKTLNTYTATCRGSTTTRNRNSLEFSCAPITHTHIHTHPPCRRAVINTTTTRGRIGTPHPRRHAERHRGGRCVLRKITPLKSTTCARTERDELRPSCGREGPGTMEPAVIRRILLLLLLRPLPRSGSGDAARCTRRRAPPRTQHHHPSGSARARR